MLIDDLTPYKQMRDNGATPHEIYRAIPKDIPDRFIIGIRILRKLFGLDLIRAKEITIQADGIADSLDEYQEKIADALEKVIDRIDDTE